MFFTIARQKVATVSGIEGDRGGFGDRLPAGTAAQMGGERPLNLSRGRLRLRLESNQPQQDAWGAEPTLGTTGGNERIDQRVAHRGRQTRQGGDRPTGDPGRGCHTRDAGVAVHEHRAASALTLRRAAVLDGADGEALAENRQERFALRDLDLDGRAVEGEVQ